MKRIQFFSVLMLVPALALVLLTGCPGPQKEKEKEKEKTDNKEKGGAKEKLKGEPNAVVKGKVTIKGEVPAMPENPAIAGHKESAICLEGKGIHILKQEWLVKDKGVANVVVWLEPPAGKEFAITDDLKKPFEKAVEINQPFCQYVPHVVAVYAKIQPVKITNSSTTLHNVKISPPKNNPATDDNMPKGSKPIEYKYKMEASPINVACSIHTWMQAKILTFDHPYFAVTEEDGSFKIANAPSDDNLTVWMWHEEKGKMKVADHKFKKGDNELPLEIEAK
jgi:hypothetical protein